MCAALLHIVLSSAGFISGKILLSFSTIRLRLFEHIQQRPPEAPVCSGVLKRVDKVKRGRGRSKLTSDESIKRDLKDWNISKEVALDRSAWRLAINVPELWLLGLLGFISSLPQLAWDKMLCCCCCVLGCIKSKFNILFNLYELAWETYKYLVYH